MKFAVYDLNTRSTSFDFLTFCMIVKSECAALGEDCCVVFKNKEFTGINSSPYPVEEKKFRLTHILYPVCTMLDLDYSTDSRLCNFEESDVLDHVNRLSLKDILEQYKKAPLFWPKPSEKALKLVEKEFPVKPVVITLRETYATGRNSNLTEWIKFAEYINNTNKVVFIRDTGKWNDKLDNFDTFPVASIDLDIRLALFKHAKINFSVSGGGTTLLNYSNDIPYRMFKVMRQDTQAPEANMKLVKNAEELEAAAKDKKDYALIDKEWLHEQLAKGYTKISVPTISGGTKVIKFNTGKKEKSDHSFAATRESLGNFAGSQFPWNNENQRIIWKDDTFENLKEEYDKWYYDENNNH